jgi:hypothetical protein
MNINDILILAILFYSLSFCINMICIDKAHLFDLRTSIVFTATYLALSPFTVFHSVGRAMETWYQIAINKKAIIDTLRAEIEGTKYDNLKDSELYAITGVLSEHLEYAELDSFEAIFQALEDDGYIAADEHGRYHYVEQTGQEE